MLKKRFSHYLAQGILAQGICEYQAFVSIHWYTLARSHCLLRPWPPKIFP